MQWSSEKGVRNYMITIRTNIGQVTAYIVNKLTAIQDKDKMLRSCAAGILPVIKTRIHEKGLDSNDQQIGIYSPGYMKVRTGNYGNSTRYTSGKRKGEVKNSGVYSRGKKKGQRRAQYNRTADTKKIYSLTRQMENDFSIQPTEKGYGLGFNNPLNAQKAVWVQEQDNKLVYGFTKSESQLVSDIAIEYIKNI